MGDIDHTVCPWLAISDSFGTLAKCSRLFPLLISHKPPGSSLGLTEAPNLPKTTSQTNKRPVDHAADTPYAVAPGVAITYEI